MIARVGSRALGTAILALLLVAPVVASADRRVDARVLERRLGKEKVVDLFGATVVGDLGIQQGATLHAIDVTFRGRIVPLPTAGGPGTFELNGCRLKRAVDLSGLRFRTARIVASELDGDLDVHSMLVEGMPVPHQLPDGLSLQGTKVHGYATFVAAALKGQLNIVDTQFDKTADFSGAQIDNLVAARVRTGAPIVIAWRQFGDRWANQQEAIVNAAGNRHARSVKADQVDAEFRFWKRNFTALGEDRDAREANYQLIRLRRHEELGLDPNTWVPYILTVANRYGTRPYQPFWIALSFVALFAVVYAVVGFTDMPRRWWLFYACAFSVQTFVPFLTIPGIKDANLKLRRAWWLEPAEGVVGVVLFGIAAYSLTVVI